jgi:rubrerythrin
MNADLRGSRSQASLREAYARDTQLAAMSRAFAEIARIEGRADEAKILEDAAEAFSLEAAGHLDFLMRAGDPLHDAPVGDTGSNLRALLVALHGDAAGPLAEAAQAARADAFPDIASWFETVRRSRDGLARRMEAALKAEP